jgi:hypothetical protein
MAQLFPRSSNSLTRASIVGAVLVISLIIGLSAVYFNSPYINQVEIVRDQPVPFSHKHHVSDVGIDCRYCHNAVEKGPSAGMPTSETCMNCHAQIWKDSPMLEPVRKSFRTGEPVKWNRVNRVPDFAYFDHSIHVARGVACTTCHGPMQEMPLAWRQANMKMSWCLECHRNPEKFIGDKKDVFKPVVQEHPHPEAQKFMMENNIKSQTDCSVCHR